MAGGAQAATVVMDAAFNGTPGTYNAVSGTLLQAVSSQSTISRNISIGGAVQLDVASLTEIMQDTISGSGPLTLTGTGGTLQLRTPAGMMTLTGPIVVSSGVKFRIDNTFGGASVASAIVDNGVTDFELSSTPYTYSSVISGSGTLQLQVVQPSGGVLILTNANTFSGAVQLGPNGTLQIGNGGTTGSIGDVSVTGGGTLSFKRSDTVTFGGTITNSILQQAGTGTLILTGASTMQVTVLSGTLQLNDGGAGSNTITTQALINGTMIVNRSDTTTITGNVIGTGQLVQAGTGTTVLAASALDLATTYLVSAGTLQFGTTTAGPAVDIRSKVIDNSVVNIVNATINTNISGSGSVVVASGGYANLAAAQSYTGGRSFRPARISTPPAFPRCRARSSTTVSWIFARPGPCTPARCREAAPWRSM